MGQVQVIRVLIVLTVDISSPFDADSLVALLVLEEVVGSAVDWIVTRVVFI